MGVSGLFYVNTAANLNGTIPKVGVSIPFVSVAGKVNVPARRKLLTTADLVAAGADDTASAPPPPPPPSHIELPRRLTADVSPAALAGLTQAGFWETLAALMPPALKGNFTSMLAAQARPAQEYMRRHNVSQADIDLYAAAFTPEGLTLQQPQLPNILQTTAIPFVVRPWRKRFCSCERPCG